MDPRLPIWPFAQLVMWVSKIGDPFLVYKIVKRSKVVIILLVIETLALLGIGTYAFIKHREQIIEWCKKRLSREKVTQEDINEAQAIVSTLRTESEKS